MKKFIYISGIVLINIIAFGAIFKIQHWPGAGVMITFGQVFFAFCFLPLAILNSYRGNGGGNKQLYIAGFICAFFVIIGSLFKIQHWPGAGILMMIGIPLPFLYFLPLYIYYHNKGKEKSSMNFLGVMFLMVFIALFSALLAVNVSRDILSSIKTASEDFSKTTEAYALKNSVSYERLEKSSFIDNAKLSELKKKSDGLSEKIENVKIELVKRTTGGDTSVIRNNKIILAKLEPYTETNITAFIMRGSDNNGGRAAEIKNGIVEYRDYLNKLLAGNKESISMINSLLNTSDSTYNADSGGPTDKWEELFFARNTYLISVLGNLECIKTTVKMAEAEALYLLECK